MLEHIALVQANDAARLNQAHRPLVQVIRQHEVVLEWYFGRIVDLQITFALRYHGVVANLVLLLVIDVLDELLVFQTISIVIV